jgi:oxygen-independent coproporphyrinogen-3 oxidase
MSSLYLHIPFCQQKCPYCDFFSRQGSWRDIDEYVELLLIHLSLFHENNPDHISPLKTIFFGGGTPSLLTGDQLEKILLKVAALFFLDGCVEITLEANPGTVTTGLFERYRHAGVNRLSFGVQSLSHRNLRTLGRIHTAEEAALSIESARTAGFDNISLDLMFGLPDQSSVALEKEVTGLLEFCPEHISLYGLSFEEGTDFYRRLGEGTLSACEEDLYAEQYELIHDILESSGFDHYEISNFARPGRECVHNQNYWRRKTSLGLGAGAHSFNESGWGERWHVPADIEGYRSELQGGRDPLELLEQYNHAGAMSETVYLALRTKAGLDPNRFGKKFNRSFNETFAKALKKTEPYLEIDDPTGCYRLNLSGWLIYDHLISHFL